MADTATFSAAMKTKFIGPIRDQLYAGKVLLFGGSNTGGEGNPEGFKGILASAENIDFVGNEFRIPYKAKRNNSVGFRSENETLPAPGSGQYTYLQEPMRYAYALFSITGQLMAAADNNEGAFKTAFKAEMEDTTLASKLDFDRAAHGDGTGQITPVRVSGTTGNTTINVNTTVRFRGGEIIDFTTATGTVVSAAHEVTGVDRANRQITISPGLAANVTAGTHFPVRASSDSTTAVPNNSLNKEIQGLNSIVAATGTLHGLNPTTYPWWASYVSSNGGTARPISDSLMRLAKDTVGFEQGIDVDSGLDFALLTTRGVRSRYADTLTALKRFNDDSSMKLRGGFDALMFDNNPMFVDDAVDPGTMFGLALNRFFWAQLSDWDWMNKDGDVLKWESRKDRYIAILYKYCQLGTTHRGAHFRINDLVDDVR